MPNPDTPMRLRLTLAAIGAVAGLFFWLLFDFIPDLIADQRVLMLITVFSGILAGGLTVMVGRLGLMAAVRYAGFFGLVAALLVFWASFRFDSVGDFINAGHPLVALALLIWLPLPFAMAQETATTGWRDYEALFDHAWSIFVRAITAWGFTGLFWLVLFLSDQLLGLVGFDYIGRLLEQTWFSLPMTGVVLGLAMAVLNELKTVVSTLRRLALQLLRLLLPIVTAVVALFIVLVPFQGLEKVFGSLSAAGTMLAMAAGAVTLISSAIDGRDQYAAQTRLMEISARALSVLLPVISGIAVFAIWLRVAQYGWTPPRIAAALVSVVVLFYALAYAVSVLLGEGWRARIREANRWMAISVIFLAGLWLTPVLNVEKMSAKSHVDRFIAGRISVGDIDPWRLQSDWGRAGQAALARLRAIKDHPDQVRLDDKLARFDAGETRWQYDNADDNQDNARLISELRDLLPVRPVEAGIPHGALSALPRITVQKILKSCRDPLADGRPGCAAIVGKFDADGLRPAVILFWRRDFGPGSEISVLEQRDGEPGFDYHRSAFSLEGELESRRPDDLIGQVLDGRFGFMPARLNALEIDGVQVLPRR